MLNDEAMAARSAPGGTRDRRSTQRLTGQSELLISWHHDPGQGVRYRLVNESTGGCLITSAVPLVDGMTGTILGRLPDGGHRAASVLVAWSRNIRGQWHIGLRYFGVV